MPQNVDLRNGALHYIYDCVGFLLNYIDRRPKTHFNEGLLWSNFRSFIVITSNILCPRSHIRIIIACNRQSIYATNGKLFLTSTFTQVFNSGGYK